jgi:hypothetical protein
MAFSRSIAVVSATVFFLVAISLVSHATRISLQGELTCLFFSINQVNASSIADFFPSTQRSFELTSLDRQAIFRSLCKCKSKHFNDVASFFWGISLSQSSFAVCHRTGIPMRVGGATCC